MRRWRCSTPKSASTRSREPRWPGGWSRSTSGSRREFPASPTSSSWTSARSALLPARPAPRPQRTFGKLLVVAGAAAYPGAALLASAAAYRVGAGLVTLATPASLISGLVAAMPEVTYLPLPEGSAPGTVGCSGAVPGAGGGPALRRAPHRLRAGPGARQRRVRPPTVAGRRAGRPARGRHRRGRAERAGRQRLAAACAGALRGDAPSGGDGAPGGNGRGGDPGSAAATGAGAGGRVGRDRCLEGRQHGRGRAGSARPGSARWRRRRWPRRARATCWRGALGGLLAQRLAPFEAACLAVYLHGKAGERAARVVGRAGTTASDVLAQLAPALRALAGEEPLEGPRFGPGGGLAALLGEKRGETAPVGESGG